jgi:AcrR family transcriptional regulator
MAAKKQPQRATYHHGDLKNGLLEAALEIIAESGSETFTLREAARRLGVNHRAVYRHFADKTTLLAAVAEQGFAALTETGQKEMARYPESDVEARLLALARGYLKFSIDHPGHFRVMFGPRLNEDGRFPSLEATVSLAFRMLRAEITRGVELRTFPEQNTVDATVSMWSAMHGFATLVLTRRIPVKKTRLGEYSDRIIRPVLAGLRL